MIGIALLSGSGGSGRDRTRGIGEMLRVSGFGIRCRLSFLMVCTVVSTIVVSSVKQISPILVLVVSSSFVQVFVIVNRFAASCSALCVLCVTIL